MLVSCKHYIVLQEHLCEQFLEQTLMQHDFKPFYGFYKLLIIEFLESLWVLNFQQSMSAEFIVRDMDPFVVILRKAIASFRKRIFSSENILVRTVVDSVFFFYLL